MKWLIEKAIAEIEAFVGRKLSGEEILIIGLAYQKGFSDGLNYEKRSD